MYIIIYTVNTNMSNSNGNQGNTYEELSKLVHLNLPLSILDKMDDYVKFDKYGKKNTSRTSAIIELIKVGLWFASKRDELETIFNNPDLMEEITGQLKEGGLVDFVQRMDSQQFQVVWSIFKLEAKARKFK